MRSMSCRVASWVTRSAAGSPVTCSSTNTMVTTPSMAVSENASRRIRYSLTARPPQTVTTAAGSAAPRRVGHVDLQIRPGRPVQVARHAVRVGRAEQRDRGGLVLVHQLQLLGDLRELGLVRR